MASTVCYVNGRYLALNDATLPVQDLAILRGYGVFDFLRTYHGRPFRLGDHLQRLARSARLIELDLPRPLEKIEEIVLQTLHRNNLPEANVRIVVTGGVSADSIQADASPGLVVLVTPAHIYPADYYTTGIKAVTVQTERYIPLAKTINYIPALLALKQAKAAGAAEALYVNRQGHILEGTTTNLFIFAGQQLITPKDDILPGVTRNVVLQLAQRNFDVVQRPITFDDVTQASEAFITASNKEVMPVIQIDAQTVGNGSVGANTRWLMDDFRRFTRGQSI